MSHMLCSMGLCSGNSGPASGWAPGKNTNFSWAQSFFNMASLLRDDCGYCRLVFDTGLSCPLASASHLAYDYGSYLLFPVLWICTKPLSWVPSVCHDTLGPGSNLVPSGLWLPKPLLTSLSPYLPPTYLCWGHNNRWGDRSLYHPMSRLSVPVEIFSSARLDFTNPIQASHVQIYMCLVLDLILDPWLCPWSIIMKRMVIKTPDFLSP